jgi:hypothetical protein
MSVPIPPPATDPNLRLDDDNYDDSDPEAPRLVDLDNPEPEPGTDIVPPAPSEAEENETPL